MLPFTITGRVVHGNALGTVHDSPTANIVPEQDVSALSHGVYYSVVTINGCSYPAITNLGVRPTVSDDGPVNAETFIYGYNKDLYGRSIKVELLEFKRGEQKFRSVEELYDTVRQDLADGAGFHGISFTSSSIASV